MSILTTPPFSRDEATLTLFSNDPDSPEVSLTLNGLTIDPQPSFSDLDTFPITMPHTLSPPTQTLTVTNNGFGPLAINNIDLVADSPFILELPADIYEPLERYESHTMTLSFEPDTAISVTHNLSPFRLQTRGPFA